MKKRIFTFSLILVLLLTLLTGCSSKEETAQKNSLHIVVAAPFATEEQANALKDAIVSAAPELDSEDLPLSVSHIATGDTEKDPYGAMAGMSQMTVRMMSDEIELLICDADNARRHGDNGETYIPLSELLTEEEIRELNVVPATIPLIDDAGNLIFKGTWMRLMRRTVRDFNFRGTGAGETLAQWGNIRRGEKLYISPFKDKADLQFDSSFAYEVPVLNNTATELFRSIPGDTPRYEELMQILPAFQLFEDISPELLRPDSLLREFVGGSRYEY